LTISQRLVCVIWQKTILASRLAASTHAGLWRCPVCPPKRHALLMVSADEYQCLSGYPCDGGASEWMQSVAEPTDSSWSYPMVKRLLKVAEILIRRSPSPERGDILVENTHENHDSEEIEYRETKDQLSIA